MAGSYKHATTKSGKLREPFDMVRMLENGGDVWEALEEMYGMIWWLADGDSLVVESARQNYQGGIKMSPGIAKEK